MLSAQNGNSVCMKWKQCIQNNTKTVDTACVEGAKWLPSVDKTTTEGTKHKKQ